MQPVQAHPERHVLMAPEQAGHAHPGAHAPNLLAAATPDV